MITTYDASGRKTKVTNGLGDTTGYAHDAAGQLIAETDALGQVTHYAFDAAGRQTSITDPLGGVAHLGYDAAGRLLSTTDPIGHLTSLTYDTLGDVVSHTDASGATTRSTYDAAGRLASRTNARGAVAKYSYDAAGRLNSVQHPGGTDTFAYDAAGRRSSLMGAAGTTTLGYDFAGRLTSAASPQGTIGYSYDAAGRRTGLTLPGGQGATYTYDAAGLLAGLVDASGFKTAFSHDADGRLAGITRPNGVSTNYTYDGAGRLVGIVDAGGSGSLESFRYTLDANGNRVSMTSGAGTEGYALDANQRLVGATYADGSTTTYAYDAAGNRVSSKTAAGTTAYSYDSGGRLVAAGSTNYSYDADGNVVAAGGSTYSYDWANELLSASVGGTSTSYAYDPTGLRVASTGGSAAAFLWDRTGAVAQVVGDGTVSYLRQDSGELLSQQSASATTYPLADALGSVRDLTSSTGSVVGTAAYDVFGGVRAQTGATSSFGFTGQQLDPTGLLYLRARYYDPVTGRFQSADSLDVSGPGTSGYNRYVYGQDDPANILDPTGHGAFAEFAARLSLTERDLAVLSAFAAAILVALILRTCLLSVNHGLCVAAPALPRYGDGTDNPAQGLARGAAAAKAAARAAAATCAAAGIGAMLGLLPKNPCDLLPIDTFFIGQDLSEPTNHDLNAIKRYPELWVFLTRGPNSAPDRSWKDRLDPCPSKTSTQNCDEYPFFATVQGGPAAPGHPQADLMNLDAAQNQLQGSRLGTFIILCKIPIYGEFQVSEGPITRGVCGKA